MCGNSVWHCVYKICGLFWWRISDFRLCCRRLSPTEISAYFKNFSVGQPTKVKPVLCLTNYYKEVCWRYRPGDEGEEGQSGRLGKVCSVERI